MRPRCGSTLFLTEHMKQRTTGWEKKTGLTVNTHLSSFSFLLELYGVVVSGGGVGSGVDVVGTVELFMLVVMVILVVLVVYLWWC